MDVQQLQFIKKQKAYGGELLKTRKGRSAGRPLSTKATMHLILRSTKATGEWSFKRSQNSAKIRTLADRFASKNGVRILSIANVGNHLHLHIKLTNRYTYRAFIRGLTAAIRMAITGASRWNPQKMKFWDYRPFTRIVESYREYLVLRDYLVINELEGLGVPRDLARRGVAWRFAQNSP